MMKMRYLLLLLCLTSTLVFAFGGHNEPNNVRVEALGPERKFVRQGRNCDHVLFTQPESRFAAFRWCEDALGSHLAVMDIGHLGPEQAWNSGPESRTWTDESWGSDVTFFQFSPDGSQLIVDSSEIYGSGKIYLLTLAKKQAKVLEGFPTEYMEDYSIKSVDWKSRKLVIEYLPVGKKKTKQKEMLF